MKLAATTLIVALVAITFASDVYSQGILIPANRRDDFVMPLPGRRPRPQMNTYRIDRLQINANIKGQIAETSVSQTFVNTGSRQLEATFVFPLPYDGAIDRLTFLVDGKELEAKLMNAEKAREIYNGYVRQYKDPALLEWVGTGLFKTSVFPIPPGAERTVTLKYSQLLKQNRNVVDYLFPLATAKYTAEPIKSFDLRVSLSADSDIKNIFSPTHKVVINRDDQKNAVVKFEAKDAIPVTDFRLFFDTDQNDVGANVISYWPEGEDQGYFVLLASPKIQSKSSDQPTKNVIFVVDRSGSMNGKKIEQAREAAKYVMNNLNEGDLFNVISYESGVTPYKPELERFTNDSRPGAIGFINSINAGGSTNIDAALTTAMQSIKNDSNPSYVVFLTDGRPTAGETNEMKIAKKITGLNKFRSRLISFGVGYDVNSRLIDRLTRDNFGQSEFVRPDEDIEAAVSRLFEKISSPVMTNIAINYEFDDADIEKGKIVNRVYPSDSFDLFAGQQMVIVGRYQKSGPAKVVLNGQINKEEKRLSFQVDFADKGSENTNRFVEKIWAQRRIGEIIDLIDLKGHNDELVQELVKLSTRHGIITPYTSFLADENAPVADVANFALGGTLAKKELGRLGDASGKRAHLLRQGKGQFKSAQIAQSYGVPAPAAAGVGGGGRSAGRSLGAGVGGLRGGDDESRAMAPGLRQVDGSTVYKRGKVIIADNALDVDLEKDKDKIIEIARYSDEYFKLVADNTTSENKLMSAQVDDEELIIKLRDKVYRIK